MLELLENTIDKYEKLLMDEVMAYEIKYVDTGKKEEIHVTKRKIFEDVVVDLNKIIEIYKYSDRTKFLPYTTATVNYWKDKIHFTDTKSIKLFKKQSKRLQESLIYLMSNILSECSELNSYKVTIRKNKEVDIECLGYFTMIFKVGYFTNMYSKKIEYTDFKGFYLKSVTGDFFKGDWMHTKMASIRVLSEELNDYMRNMNYQLGYTI